MSRGWCSVTVEYELALVDPEADGTTEREPAPAEIEAEPRSALVIEVDAANHTDEGQRGLFRLTGLGSPLIADVGSIPPSHRFERRTLRFELPERLDAGRNPVAIEWIHADRGQTKRLAVADLVVVVQDVSLARIELTPRLTKGLLSGSTELLLENNGTGPLT